MEINFRHTNASWTKPPHHVRPSFLILVSIIVAGILSLILLFTQRQYLQTVSAVTSSLNLNPIEDAHVRSDLPDNNYGTASNLEIDGSPVEVTYLKFDLTSLANKTLIAAKLRMKVANGSGSTQVIKNVNDNTWTETSIAYNTRPTVGATVNSFVGGAAGNWIEIDVTSGVTDKLGQIMTLAIDSTGSDGLWISSKETVDKPALLVDVNDAAPAPTSTPTPTPTPDPSAPTPTPTPIPTNTPTPTPDTGAPITSAIIAAAGDIACDPSDKNLNVVAGGVPLGKGLKCRMKYTADLIKQINPEAVLALGDIQYENGDLAKYSKSFEPSGWVDFKSKTHVTSGGGHDKNGKGDFYTYWGANEGPSLSQTWKAFDIGSWRVYQINANCNAVDCNAEETWFRNDLAAQNTNTCLLAFWHFPLYGSGLRGSGTSQADIDRRAYSKRFYQAFYDYGGDLLLVGHDHDYERFAPQDPNGNLNLALGVREIVVGTGGQSINGFIATVPNREAGNTNTIGVLKVTLNPTSYDWEFIPSTDFTGNGTFTDSGTTICH